jgi:hypothetical protein
LGRLARLLGRPGYLLGRCRAVEGRALGVRSCILRRACLRTRGSTGIRRGGSVHSSCERFRGGPRSYSKRPAKAYRIHTLECSRSASSSKDSPLPSNADPVPVHPSRKKIRERANDEGNTLFHCRSVCCRCRTHSLGTSQNRSRRRAGPSS